MEYRNIERNGSKRTVPITRGRKASKRNAPKRHISPREMKDLRKVGIKHPGSLTKYGYHLGNSKQERENSLNKAVKRYGQKTVLEKLSDLYRLDYNRPHLRGIIVEDIRYVSKGKRSD